MKKTNFAFNLLTVLMIAAVPAFGQFASTTLSPASQLVEAGSSVSVDINWSIAYNSDPTRGIEAWLNFDPSVLQVVSVTSAGAPFSNEEINTFDNTSGTIDFKATGSAVNSGNYAIATIVFQAIAAGTSPINFSNVHQYFTYYGPYGVNGQTSGASVEVEAGDPPPTSLGISGWEMNRGGGYIYLNGTTLAYHGDPAVYAWATIPQADDTNWGPAPNSETIGFSEYSSLPGVLTYADFTYFQTFLSIPEDTQINACYVNFNNADDGAQITIFNSSYPSGYSPSDANIRLGGPANTSDISSWIAIGEVNRVVITQVDNQATGNNLQYAAIVLNGEAIIPEPECEPTYQTITILGANGNPGDVDPYADASLDGGTTWQPAILTGGPHPFDNWYFGGNMISGTNSWINYQQNWDSPSWASETNPLYVDFRIRFNVPEDYTDPSMTLQVRVDNEAIVKLNGVELASISGYGSPAVPEATLNTAIQVGYNEITLRLVDYGGIIAMAYRIDLSMYSCENLADAVDPSDGSQNQAPVAHAGNDQTIDCVIGSADVTLNGSGSDADGDALSYSWSYAGNEVSTDASFNTTLAAGDHTFTLTVSDGVATSSDDVVVHVIADDQAPELTLAGDNPFSLGLYTAFDDPGYSVNDACDSDPVVTVTSDVDVNIPGSYTITYTAEDAAGNNSSVERTVEVINTAPEVATAPTDIVLSYGDDILSSSIDLSSVFADADTNDILTYSYTNGDAGVASAVLAGSVLTFDAVDLGEMIVTITAVDPWGASVSADFTVTVNVTENLAGSLLFAYSKIKIKKDTQINSGNLIVNDGSQGDHHDDEDDDHGDDDHGDDDHGDDDHGDDNGRGHDSHQEYQIKLDKDVMVAANYFLMADGIQIQKDAQVASDVYANTLDNRGNITGEIFGDVQTPVFATLPPFKSAPAGTEDITVNKNQEVVLEPGDYGRIYVKDRGTITFTGGVYNISKLEAKKSARIRFEDATEVRVADDVKISKQSYVGPAEGSFIDASSIIFYVAGDDHHAFKIEEDVNFFGTIYAQTGEVDVKKEVSFTGAILADEIDIDKEADMWLDSYFGGSGAGLAKGFPMAWIEPEVEFDAPEQFELTSNYPNPFNPSTTISYALKEAGPVSLKIYDIRGAEVTELVNGYQESGHYNVHFSPQNLSSGTYLYVLEAGSFREVKRMVYLK